MSCQHCLARLADVPMFYLFFYKDFTQPQTISSATVKIVYFHLCYCPFQEQKCFLFS